MKNKILLLRIILLLIVVVWVALQFIFVEAYGNVSFIGGDDAAYRVLAQRAIDMGTWYPNVSAYHDNFIFAPGYVNYLIVVFHFWGSYKASLYFNIIFNFCILLLIWRISKNWFGEKVPIFACVGYMLLPSNMLAPVVGLTELPFIFLSLLALLLAQNDKKIWSLIMSGVVLAVANWVRPLAIAWVLAIVIWLVLKYKESLLMIAKKLGCFIGGYLLIILLIGLFTKMHFQDFNCKSTTGGWNLIMGANDDCNGTYNDDVFKKGNIGYIDDNEMSYKERDSYFKSQSIKWIKHNPIKWISYLPSKIWYLFMYDNQYDMSGNLILSQPLGVKMISKIAFSNKFVRTLHKILFWFLLMLSFLSLRYVSDTKVLMLQIIVVVATGITLITVGHPRYHQVFMPEIIICACYMLYKTYSKVVNMNKK